MPCFNPWPAWELQDGSIVLFPRAGQNVRMEKTLPCGSCVGCLQERARQWAVRCIHEAQMHERNCFITLTYNDENLPAGMSLNYGDFQRFMRKLRKHFKNKKIRFFMCGEYGESFTRPHFHACLFGLDFDDKQPIRKLDDKNTLYTSATLESLWNKGFSSIGAVTVQSAAYVARYVMKKVQGKQATPHYTYIDQYGEIHERKKEFNKMSLKPGIGATWLEKYYTDVYPSDQVIQNGQERKPPRYYDKKLKELDAALFDELQQIRISKLQKGENTEQRLQARHTVAKAKAKLLTRKLS